MAERRFTNLRKRLDQLGYKQPLGLDSVPLVEKLFSDLVHTTESLKNAKLQQSRLKSSSVSSNDDLIEPYRNDNAKLVRENNELHLELIRLKEELDAKIKDYKGSVRRLESENADLKFLNTQYAHKVKTLEKESKAKSDKILSLQEKNLHAVVQTPGGKQKNIAYRRQRMDLNGLVPPPSKSNALDIGDASDRQDPFVADLLQVADNRIADLESTVETLEGEKEGMDRRIKSLRKQVETRDSEIERLQKLLEGGRPASAVMKDTKHDSGDRVIAHLNVQVDYLQQANRDLENQIREALDGQQQAIDKTKDLQGKNDELCLEIRDLGLLVHKMEEDRDQHNEAWEKQVKELEDELETKHQTILDTQAELYKVKKERENLMDENDNLSNILKLNQEDIKRVTEMFERSEKEKRRLQEKNAKSTMTERDLVMELERLKISKSLPRKNTKSPDRVEQMIRNLEDDRDFYKEECQSLQDFIKNRLVGKEAALKISTKDKSRGNVEGMLELMQEERDFYKKEYEMMRNLKDRFNSVRSPPTKEWAQDTSSEASRLRRERDELQSMLQKFERHLAEIQNSVRTLTTEKDNVQLLYEQATEEIQRLRRQLARARSPSPSRKITGILDRVEKERDDAMGELRRMRTDFQNLENQLRTLNENQVLERGRFEHKAADLEGVVDKIEQDRNELQSRVVSLRSMVSSLEEQLKTTSSTLRSTREDLADKEAETSKLRLLLEQENRNAEDLKKRLDKKIGDLGKSDDERRNLEDAISDLQRKNENQKDEINRLQGVVNSLDRERDLLQQQVDDKTEELVAADTKRKKQEKAEKDLKIKMDELEENLRKKVQETTSKEKEVKGLSRQTQSLESELSDVTRTRDAVIQENKRLQEDLTTMTEENQNVHQDLQDALAEQDLLKNQVAEYANQVARVEELLAQKDQEKEDLLLQYQTLSSKAELLETNVQQTAGEATAFRQEAVEKEKELATYSDRCQALEEEIQHYIAAQESYEQQLSTMATSLSTMEEQLRSANEEKEAILLDLAAVRDLCVKLDNARESLSKQLAARSVDHEQLQSMLDEAKTETENLKRQVYHERDTVKSLENIISATREKSYYEQQSREDIIKELDKTRGDLTKSERERNLKTSEATSLRQTVDSLQSDLTQLQHQLTSERFERERLTAEVRRKTISPKPSTTLDYTTRSSYTSLLKSTEISGPGRSYPTALRQDFRAVSPPPSPVRPSTSDVISPTRNRSEGYNSDTASEAGP